MFQQLISTLLGTDWGRKIPGPDGKLHDTGVKEFAEQLASALQKMSEGEIQVSSPIILVNTGQGPALRVQQYGGSAAAIQVDVPGGPSATMGVGLGNQGLVANEVVPNPQYALPPESINRSMSTLGQNGGAVTPTPGEGYGASTPQTTGTLAGSGPLPANVPQATGGSGSGESPGSGAVGHGYKGYPSGLPVLKRSTNTGAGAGSGPPPNLPVLYGGGGNVAPGGSTVHTGIPQGVPVIPTFSVADFLGNMHVNSNGFMEGRINNITVLWQTGSSGGASGSQTVVTAVSCNAGSLSVTTASMGFTNGLYTGTT